MKQSNPRQAKLALPVITALLAACGGDGELGGPAEGVTEPVIDPAIAVVAHRGGSAYAPENTMPAIENAYRLGVDEIEVDVMYSADDEVVIIHDDTLSRTTDCEGDVISQTLAELRACDAAFWFLPGQPVTVPDESGPHPLRGSGVTIPTLRELYEHAVAEGPDGPLLLVEVKSIPGESNFDPISFDIASDVVALTREFALEDRVAVQSFWPLVIEFVQAIAPEVETRFLTTHQAGQTAAGNVIYTIAQGHDGASPNFDAPDFTAEVIDLAQSAGKRVIPYTVNLREDLERIAGLGVDGMITDFPACLLMLQGRLSATRITPENVPDLLPCPE